MARVLTRWSMAVISSMAPSIVWAKAMPSISDRILNQALFLIFSQIKMPTLLNRTPDSIVFIDS